MQHTSDRALGLDSLPLVLNCEEAARALRCSRHAIYQLLREKKLRAVQIGQRGLRIPRASLLEFLEGSRGD